jgi:NAD(P)-dependent dehydrogenase (short-subunit alcohol dehydrogenase family)
MNVHSNGNGSSSTDSEAPVYLIAGAYGGIGGALVRGLRKRGARLALVGRDPDRLEQISRETDSVDFQADVSNFQQMSDVVAQVVEWFGKLDGAACLTGSLLLKPAHTTTADEWHDVISANLTTAFSFVRACAKPMIRTGGSVVLVSSAVTRIGLANHDAIAAAKSGVEGLVKSSAATYARYGIRVNCVAPGLIDTDLTRSVTQKPALLDAALEMYGIKRPGTPEDVAFVIEWLLGTQSTWVTGQSFGVDGGLSSVKLSAPVRANIS